MINFGAMVEYYPITSRDESRLHHFGEIFLGYTSLAEGIWKGDILVADVEELEKFWTSETHGRRLNAKDIITPKKG